MKIKKIYSKSKEFLDLIFLAILLSILLHYSYNLFLIIINEKIVVYEENKLIILAEMILVIASIMYVTYKIIKKW